MTKTAGIAVLAAVLLAAAAIPSYHLVVTGDGAERLWTLPLRPGTQVILAYENSIYRAATEEMLTTTAEGFTLHAVRSTSEAVLAYNGLEAPYRQEDGWRVAAVSRSLPVLVLRIGRTGRQQLRIGDHIIPLHEAGEGTRLRVDVERAPRLVAALRAWVLQ